MAVAVANSASFCRSLAIKHLDLGVLLLDLSVQELPLNRYLRGGGAGRWLEAFKGSASSLRAALILATSSSALTEIALEVFQLGFIHGGVEFDQNVSAP